jgi:hypothetical protein
MSARGKSSKHVGRHKDFSPANTDDDIARRLDSLQRAFANYRQDFHEAISDIKKLVVAGNDSGGLISYDN